MTRYPVGRVSEWSPGSKKIIRVEGRSIGVYNVDGQFYAIRNLCPHQGAELCAGITTSFVTSNAPGEFCFEREGEIVRCPWHFGEFDIKTGQMVVDPRTRTKTYDVTVERYDVTVDEEQIFVHM
ncbi:Rieske (2Fe-2S) protein [Paenibacillus hemerocallicola]|uniref:Rieske (2Fe-2S) protein n=1 Tax=Paenibacillus hemerocallicola TaxID=1172614 RepID=A0A5C4T4D8_9BACL|nr:Rieske (2Fe-2S) protein [Paenibacillus hemerocallicola]TNJ63883.1 Rieske (2Fe-2S) protein [Paenibacillus hemerocallicola]